MCIKFDSSFRCNSILIFPYRLHLLVHRHRINLVVHHFRKTPLSSTRGNNTWRPRTRTRRKHTFCVSVNFSVHYKCCYKNNWWLTMREWITRFTLPTPHGWKSRKENKTKNKLKFTSWRKRQNNCEQRVEVTIDEKFFQFSIYYWCRWQRIERTKDANQLTIIEINK